MLENNYHITQHLTVFQSCKMKYDTVHIQGHPGQKMQLYLHFPSRYTPLKYNQCLSYIGSQSDDSEFQFFVWQWWRNYLILKNISHNLVKLWYCTSMSLPYLHFQTDYCNLNVQASLTTLPRWSIQMMDVGKISMSHWIKEFSFSLSLISKNKVWKSVPWIKQNLSL